MPNWKRPFKSTVGIFGKGGTVKKSQEWDRLYDA